MTDIFSWDGTTFSMSAWLLVVILAIVFLFALSRFRTDEFKDRKSDSGKD